MQDSYARRSKEIKKAALLLRQVQLCGLIFIFLTTAGVVLYRIAIYTCATRNVDEEK